MLCLCLLTRGPDCLCVCLSKSCDTPGNQSANRECTNMWTVRVAYRIAASSFPFLCSTTAVPEQPVIMAARSSTQARSQLEPLTAEEVTSLMSLISRAEANYQLDAVLDLAGISRRAGRDPNEPWEMVTPREKATTKNSKMPSSSGCPMPPPSPTVQDPVDIPVVTTVVLPTGITSIEEWGRTLFQLPKYKSKQWSYARFVRESWDNMEMLSYVKWLINQCRSSADRPEPGKASDVVGYLLAIGCEPEQRDR